ncbi:MAG: DUF401 family protein [Nitrososphaeria archaeon]
MLPDALPLIGASIAFALVLLLVLRKVNLGLALVLGSFVLGVFALTPQGMVEAFTAAVTARATLELVITVGIITIICLVYEGSGMIKQMIDSLEHLIADGRIVAALTPAVFGLLPVLGGALFSAPLVETEGNRLGLNSEQKAYDNLWFRHVVFLIYPLETALITASYLSGFTIGSILLYQVPIFLVAVAAGYLTVIRPVKFTRSVVERDSRWIRKLVLSFSPILVALLLALGFGAPLYLSVLAALTVLLLMVRPAPQSLGRSLRKRLIPEMIATAFGFMIFRYFIDASRVFDSISPLVGNGTVSPVVLSTIFPAALGFLLGAPAGAIALSVPLLAGIYTLTPVMVALIYTSVYMGHNISPMHLCFAVTCQYFKTRIKRLYRLYLPAALMVLAAAIALTLLFYP